ncbi:Tim10/DDP family zinc finger-domain-containing protein [Boletus edulis BED1]|uniref:Mitochondrial import inner membrane translocase subunit n=1 Tax=Boletus edulis BED1 TaxID=1328754 RepID=A0AAD4BL04_BOLED|nr:Tim10/DDP family zinc finger-domain-containing protein [Boletus edulis BED1]
MSDFFRSSSSNTKPDLATQRDTVLNAIRAEINLATAQELISKTSEKCFAKCVTKPGTSLSSSEETCLSRCMDRYLEAFNIVSRTLTSRANQHGRESAL